MHQGKQAAFRRQFRECFALLLDDLTFLAGKKATQVEFLHTFDALVADGCQVVVTCDCHPRLTEDLMPELADRLLGGAVWGVLPPDPETRLALLQAKAGRAPADHPGGRACSSWRATCAATSASWKGRSTACGTSPA